MTVSILISKPESSMVKELILSVLDGARSDNKYGEFNFDDFKGTEFYDAKLWEPMESLYGKLISRSL